MGACASAPREPHPEAREDADVPAPSFRAKATATSSLVDPEVGRSVRHDRRASGVSRDNSKNGASETRGAPVADLAGCPVATAKRGRSRLSVSSPKKKSGGDILKKKMLIGMATETYGTMKEDACSIIILPIRSRRTGNSG